MAHTDVFRNLHPASIAVYFLSVTLIAMFVQDPVIYALALAGGIIMRIWITGDTGYGWWAIVVIPIAVALTNPIVSHLGNTVMFRLFGIKFTLESLIYGIYAGIMLAALIIWFACMGNAMGSDKAVWLFGRGFPRMAMTLTIAIRFIPLMMRRMNRISRVRKTLGLTSSAGRRERINSTSGTLVTLVAASTENAMDTAASMNARGYGLKGRTNLVKYRFRASDILTVLICVMSAGAVIFASVSDGLGCSFYPKIVYSPVTPVNITAYALYGLLVVFIPLMKAVEEIKWKYCISKI